MLILDFINVGYGDAILLRDTAAGSAVLVDVGDVSVGDVSVGDGGPGAKSRTCISTMWAGCGRCWRTRACGRC